MSHSAMVTTRRERLLHPFKKAVNGWLKRGGLWIERTWLVGPSGGNMGNSPTTNSFISGLLWARAPLSSMGRERPTVVSRITFIWRGTVNIVVTGAFGWKGQYCAKLLVSMSIMDWRKKTTRETVSKSARLIQKSQLNKVQVRELIFWRL